MKAIILAGGRSTRLYPLTKVTPKNLLLVGEETILEQQIKGLLAHGVREFVFVLGFFGHKIKKHITKTFPKLRVTYITNPKYKTTNAIYGLWLARHEFTGSAVIFGHSDVLFEPQVVADLCASRHTGKTMLVYKKCRTDAEAGKIIVNSRQRITALGKKIPLKQATGEYLQLAKFERPFITEMRKQLEIIIGVNKEYQLYTINLFNEVIKNPATKAYGLEIKKRKIIEIDTPQDLERARTLFAP